MKRQSSFTYRPMRAKEAERPGWRFWFVLSLGIIVLFLEVLQFPVIYHTILLRHECDPGFTGTIRNGRLVVQSVREAFSDGTVTPAHIAGVLPGDRMEAIIGVDGSRHPMHGDFQLEEARRALPLEEPWSLEVYRGGEKILLNMPPPTRTVSLLRPVFDFIGLHVLMPFLCLAAGLFIGLKRPEDPNAFLAALVLIAWPNADAGWGFRLFPPGLRDFALLLYSFLFSSLSYLLMRFLLLFPAPSPLERRMPRLKTILMAFPIAFSLWNLLWMYTRGISYRFHGLVFDHPLAYGFDLFLDFIYVALFLVGIVSLAWNMARSRSPDSRRRLAAILLGTCGVIPMVAIFVVGGVLRLHVPRGCWMAAMGALALLPAAFAYGIVRHRLFGIRRILRMGLQHTLLSRGIWILEGAAVFLLLRGILRILSEEGSHLPAPAILVAGTALLTALFLLAVRRFNGWAHRRIDRLFFREEYDAGKIMRDLAVSAHRLTMNPDRLTRRVLAVILNTLHPHEAALFLRGGQIMRLPPRSKPRRAAQILSPPQSPLDFFCYVRMFPDQDRDIPAVDLCPTDGLPADSPLGRMVSEAGGPIPLHLEETPREGAPRKKGPGEIRIHADLLHGEKVFLDRNRPHLLIPLIVHQRRIGFLSLGEKRSQEPYSQEDQRLLENVTAHLSLTLACSQSMHEHTRGMAVADRSARARSLRDTRSKHREMTILGNLASDVARRVREPLEAIRSDADCMARTLSRKPKEALAASRIGHRAEGISTLLDCLCELGSGSTEPRKAFRLETLLASGVDRWCREVRFPRDRIVIEASRSAQPDWVSVEPGRFAVLVRNLLANAAAHGEGGSIVIRMPHAQDCFRLFEVADTGFGIPPEMRHRVFDPYFTLRRGASGLGLTLCRHIVEDWGGSIEVAETCPPPGCTIRVRIPSTPAGSRLDLGESA